MKQLLSALLKLEEPARLAAALERGAVPAAMGGATTMPSSTAITMGSTNSSARSSANPIWIRLKLAASNPFTINPPGLLSCYLLVYQTERALSVY